MGLYTKCPAHKLCNEEQTLMATILIAEDERAINDLMAANLRLVGHRCDQAHTGPEALQKAAAANYDLVLLDVMLPGLDGFAVKNRLPDTLPVIFVTARTNLTDKLRGLGWGRRIILSSRSRSLNCSPGSRRCCAAPTAARRASASTT